jgi:hypothetical protein
MPRSITTYPRSRSVHAGPRGLHETCTRFLRSTQDVLTIAHRHPGTLASLVGARAAAASLLVRLNVSSNAESVGRDDPRHPANHADWAGGRRSQRMGRLSAAAASRQLPH